jgi:hypothetical protein
MNFAFDYPWDNGEDCCLWEVEGHACILADGSVTITPTSVTYDGEPVDKRELTQHRARIIHSARVYLKKKGVTHGQRG